MSRWVEIDIIDGQMVAITPEIIKENLWNQERLTRLSVKEDYQEKRIVSKHKLTTAGINLEKAMQVNKNRSRLHFRAIKG